MATSESGGWLYRVWYYDARGGWLLWPLEGLFRLVAAARRMLFRRGVCRSIRVAAPVIVVGNISVGGSGKTPLVAWLVGELITQGLRPAIVSRGYGGSEPATPMRVTTDTDVQLSGDEAKMLAGMINAPVYVSRDRVAAATMAIDAGANVVVADDGLQHYWLARDVEVAVVDGERLHGNRHCLPAGPLREPVSRLEQVDVVVYANASSTQRPGYRLTVTEAVNAATGVRRELSEFASAPIRAIAGIGHPERFFSALRAQGLMVEEEAVGDHQRASVAQLNPANDCPVLMTAKDAVKYSDLTERHWVVPATIAMDDDSRQQLLTAIQPAING